MIDQLKNPVSLEKTQACQGYRPRNGYYYRFSKENPGSLSSHAASTEYLARLLDFFVVFDVFSFKKPGTLEKI
jgi:hypothetical protein